MALGTRAPTHEPPNPSHIEAGIEYLRRGFYAQAFLVLSESGAEQEPGARFALGLCYLHADDADMAITCFEQALLLIRALPATPSPALENSRIYNVLIAKQLQKEGYLLPMDGAYIKKFPKFARSVVLLALIHAYRQKGMLGEARKLAAGLTDSAFEGIKKSLLENL